MFILIQAFQLVSGELVLMTILCKYCPGDLCFFFQTSGNDTCLTLQRQIKEMPVNTWDNPWLMTDEEMGKRKDLRNSHLIFSIDPKGCEDVDDTLSVR